MQHRRPTQITISLLHILPSTNSSQDFYSNLKMLWYRFVNNSYPPGQLQFLNLNVVLKSKNIHNVAQN
jgi:hypothetical protein